MSNIKFIAIIIPVYNDWKSLEKLLVELEQNLTSWGIKAQCLIVDDASTIKAYDFVLYDFLSISRVDVLELKRNLGHQRAISLGFAYAEANLICDAVVVMDADGEDAPKDILKLLKKCEEENLSKLVFARRNKRSETLPFKLFYTLYKVILKMLTTHNIGVGNFSIIPYQLLCRIVAVTEIWNHYAAGIIKSKIPYTEVPTNRSYRIAGKAQMNFVSLITHGLSSITVYADIVGTRLLLLTFSLMFFASILIITVILIRFATNLAIPGWTTFAVGLLFLTILQACMLSLMFVFIILNSRTSYNFTPHRDYQYFILNIHQIFPKP